ncbi:PRC-barrel domain-containing protein [Paenibacillus tarimensis]|uniref:PRC-barrel domain-containing protein n=1 Tax=Paenibacillus tarimensis TaxID=416012 RepID=UPI001F236554|nr:PRC-barrel domain-containing protein [Paenibacillus tarimensis]MCF2944021.1 PRC-barrel domain-containing protein [Paenibacillus tarimensis]
MIKLQNVLRLPVIEVGTGDQIGKVMDLWFDEHWVASGLIIQSSRWWLTTYYTAVLWDNVQACGSDAVMIKDRNDVQRLRATEIGRTFQTGVIKLRDMAVVTEKGNQLGHVSDVYFRKEMGTPIVGFELSDGFVSDLMEGRKWLKIPADPDEVTLGEDVIIVPARCEKDLEAIVASETGK